MLITWYASNGLWTWSYSQRADLIDTGDITDNLTKSFGDI